MGRIGHIYKITSPTGSIYIGKTVRLKDRLYHYKYCSGIESQKIIYNSIKKYGWESHTLEILLETTDVDKLSELEIFYIKKYNSCRYNNDKGMNLTLGGEGTFGRVDSEETKKKRAKHHIGSKRSEKTKKLMSSLKKGKPSTRIGYVCSEETKQKVSKANKGRLPSVSTIKNRNETRLKKLINQHTSILQIDNKTKEVVKEWVMLPKEIAKSLKTCDSSIVKCLKKKHHKGYIWRYKK
jgi:group I intron endonuclease